MSSPVPASSLTPTNPSSSSGGGYSGVTWRGPASGTSAGFQYMGLAVLLAAAAVVIFFGCLQYMCWRSRRGPTRSSPRVQASVPAASQRKTLQPLPAEVHAQLPLIPYEPAEFLDSCCAICLGDYAAGEVLLRLPCRHGFHPPCASAWFEKTSTCPVCRVSLVPETQDDVSKDPEGPHQAQSAADVAIDMARLEGAPNALSGREENGSSTGRGEQDKEGQPASPPPNTDRVPADQRGFEGRTPPMSGREGNRTVGADADGHETELGSGGAGNGHDTQQESGVASDLEAGRQALGPQGDLNSPQ